MVDDDQVQGEQSVTANVDDLQPREGEDRQLVHLRRLASDLSMGIIGKIVLR